MGLWHDIRDYDRLRAVIDTGAAAHGNVVDHGVASDHVHDVHAPFVPSSAEGRHEALLWGDPQESGDAESDTRCAVCGMSAHGPCPEIVLSYDENAVLIEYAQDFEAGEELLAEYDEPFAEDFEFGEDDRVADMQAFMRCFGMGTWLTAMPRRFPTIRVDWMAAR